MHLDSQKRYFKTFKVENITTFLIFVFISQSQNESNQQNLCFSDQMVNGNLRSIIVFNFTHWKTFDFFNEFHNYAFKMNYYFIY
jgi:hypothetical protein